MPAGPKPPGADKRGVPKALSNPSSTGSAGPAFEVQVQAAFVVALATGGFIPAVPPWPVVEVRLQSGILGYKTDDFLVTVKHPVSDEKVRLLGQIKLGVRVTEGDATFGEVMTAAWADYNNPALFASGIDTLALITSHLTAADGTTLQWLTMQAREVGAQEFIARVDKAKWAPRNALDKLDVIRSHLTRANAGVPLTDDALHAFLRHYRVLVYDLAVDSGVSLSLLHSHLTLEGGEKPLQLWGRVVDYVQKKNARAGVITFDSLPRDIQDIRQKRAVSVQPVSLQQPTLGFVAATASVAASRSLALVALVGSWDDRQGADKEAVAELAGEPYTAFLQDGQALVGSGAAGLAFDEGVWMLTRRPEAWATAGALLTDDDILRLESVAMTVLGEVDRALELEPDERFDAAFRGLDRKYSTTLRTSLAGALALVGARLDVLARCTLKAFNVPYRVVRALLESGDWKRWASLDDVLPLLAEASPQAFTEAVEKELRNGGGAFKTLFGQERTGLFSRTYMSGLLWALEGLAWGADWFGPSVLLIAELAGIDPGGTWGNRPAGSLVTIFLPWLPRTAATMETRLKTLEAMSRDEEEVTWKLVQQLLPGQMQTSSPTHRPVFRPVIDDDQLPSHADYWRESEALGKLVVALAAANRGRLPTLVRLLPHLPREPFALAIDALDAARAGMEAGERHEVWSALRKLAEHHHRYPEAKWVMPADLLLAVDGLADRYRPDDPKLDLKLLFTGYAHRHLKPGEDFTAGHARVEQEKKNAIGALLASEGMPAVLSLVHDVGNPNDIGTALAACVPDGEDQTLVPAWLGSDDLTVANMAAAYVFARRHALGWRWVDALALRDWSPAARGRLFLALPFCKDTWDRLATLEASEQVRYWADVEPRAFWIEGEGDMALSALVDAGRPWAAISLCNDLHHSEKPFSAAVALDALVRAAGTTPDANAPDAYAISEVIRHLQEDPDADPDRLVDVEWLFVRLLDGQNGAQPLTLWRRLSDRPTALVELLSMMYRPDRDDVPARETPEHVSQNAWWALRSWRQVPGSGADGTFDTTVFDAWLSGLLGAAAQAGLLKPAEAVVGTLLAHAPADPDGLWLHRHAALVLDRRDFGVARDAFSTEIFNSRGAHWVDPSGKAELDLEAKYLAQAEACEAQGYVRVAQELRQVARGYGDEGRQRARRHGSADKAGPENDPEAAAIPVEEESGNTGDAGDTTSPETPPR